MGIAHDILEKVRRSLAVRSYIQRSTRRALGYKGLKKSTQSLRRARLSLAKFTKRYRTNWEAMQRLINSAPFALYDLGGLQPIDEKDLCMLSRWKEADRHDATSDLPWIWKVSGFHATTLGADPSEEWELEGTPAPANNALIVTEL